MIPPQDIQIISSMIREFVTCANDKDPIIFGGHDPEYLLKLLEALQANPNEPFVELSDDDQNKLMQFATDVLLTRTEFPITFDAYKLDIVREFIDRFQSIVKPNPNEIEPTVLYIDEGGPNYGPH